MRAMTFRPRDKEFRIEGDAAIRVRIELHHPAVDTFRVKLRIDCTVERIGEIDSLSVPADLDHLRSAVERAIRGRMRGSAGDTANPDLAGELRIERIAHVILVQIAGAPAGDVEEAIVHREIDIGDERRYRLEAFQER